MSLMTTHRDSFKTGAVFKSRRVIDPLREGLHRTNPGVAYPAKLIITGQSTPDITKSSSGSRKVIYPFPRNGNLRHAALKVAYGTSTTADYLDHLGVGILELIELKSANRRLHQITEPRMAIIFALSRLEPEARAEWLIAMGGVTIGSTSAAGTIMIWLAFFFDDQLAIGSGALNLGKLTSDLNLEITYKQNTSILKATGTGGSISSTELICWYTETNFENQSSVYHSFDYANIITDQVITKDTATALDVKGITGHIKMITMVLTLSSDLLVDFYKFKDLTVVTDKINGQLETLHESVEENKIDWIYNHQGRGLLASKGYPTEIYYVLPVFDMLNNFGGGIAGENINEHKITVTHSEAANATISVMAIINAVYSFRKGGLHRTA